MKQFLATRLLRIPSFSQRNLFPIFMSKSSIVGDYKDNLASATYLFHPENVEIDIKSLEHNGTDFLIII